METRFLQRGMLVNVLGDLCVVIGSETEVTGGIVSDCEGPCMFIQTRCFNVRGNIVRVSVRECEPLLVIQINAQSALLVHRKWGVFWSTVGWKSRVYDEHGEMCKDARRRYQHPLGV